MEIKKRGEKLISKVTQLNSKSLKEGSLISFDTKFLDHDVDIKSYALFDMEGRVVQPKIRLNEYIRSVFSIIARGWAIKTSQEKGNILTKKLKDGSIGVAGRIYGKSGKNESNKVIGVIAIIFNSVDLEQTTSETFSKKVTEDKSDNSRKDKSWYDFKTGDIVTLQGYVNASPKLRVSDNDRFSSWSFPLSVQRREKGGSHHEYVLVTYHLLKLGKKVGEWPGYNKGDRIEITGKFRRSNSKKRTGLVGSLKVNDISPKEIK